MGKVVVDLTVSLDGYIAGKDDGPDLPLGRGGEHLFTWMGAGPESNRLERRLAPPDASKVVVEEWMTQSGAIISGRRTFDIATGGKKAIRSTSRYSSSLTRRRRKANGARGCRSSPTGSNGLSSSLRPRPETGTSAFRARP